jgi:hypothetical protein
MKVENERYEFLQLFEVNFWKMEGGVSESKQKAIIHLV